MNTLGTATYLNAIGARLSSMVTGVNPKASVVLYVDDVLARMQPRDPMEEMLTLQAILANARVMHLTELACRQTDLDALRVVNEAADRATNTTRRIAQTLADLRRPPALPSFTAIRQTNIAAQQVVANGNAPDGKATNEQGSAPIQPQPQPEAAPALPAVAGGLGLPARFSPPDAAVGEVHGPAHAGREGASEPQRL
ncbi:MAG: hypothetical protein KIT19_10765 [Phycisphaeraceae bacterium]|nr:hypothetical protein [Phycisphaeraceae bacterium]